MTMQPGPLVVLNQLNFFLVLGIISAALLVDVNYCYLLPRRTRTSLVVVVVVVVVGGGPGSGLVARVGRAGENNPQ